MSQAIRSRTAKGASTRQRTGSRTTVACVSCKDRKVRCDGQTPACGNCQRNRLACFIEDPTTKRQQPRNYIETLEQQVLFLQEKLQAASTFSRREPEATFNHRPSTSSELGSSTVADDDDLSSMVGTLSLNAAGSEPSYLGPSSTFAFSRFMKPAIQASLTPRHANFGPHGNDAHSGVELQPCALPDYHTAVQLSNAYFQNIQTQYPFLHEATFRDWEVELQDPEAAIHNLNYAAVPLYFLNMVYAVGALLLPSLGYSAERLYVSAMLYIDDIICHDNLECIQAILCCGTYSLRSFKGTSHWKLGGLALRQCVNLGYHRSQRRLRSTASQFQQEMQKRAFWSAYVLECTAAVFLGRPLSLHLQDIDVEFPLDIDETSLKPEGICGPQRTLPTERPTLMTHAIHGFRIRSLFGSIQSALYADCSVKDSETRRARGQKLISELEEWRSSAPPPIDSPAGGVLSFFMTPDWNEISYNYAILQIYRVQIADSRAPAPDEVFLTCLNAARHICHGFRRQYFGKPTTYTWGALHEIFLAGLTYIYCLWTSQAARQASRYDQVSRTCMDCTLFLVILAERWPDAAPYRDIFEVLSTRTMTMMTDAHHDSSIASFSIAQEHETHAQDLSQWMAGISDTGLSIGADWLLSELIDEFPTPGHFSLDDNDT